MSYQIADQPIESRLRDYVVRPSVPLIASMVGGAWIGWPWFAFNAIAMGSPTRKKEIGLVAAAFAITAVLAAILIALVDANVIPDEGIPVRLALLAITTFKLTISQYISVIQNRMFHVYEYYKGPVRPAQRALFAVRVLRVLVIGLIDHPLWVIIVASGAASWLTGGIVHDLCAGMWGSGLGALFGGRW